MLLRKQGFPEEDEIVICTVKTILNSAVFAHLDEYGRDGMINISEVSPGRIRNLRDFVTEGKKIVCKVLRIDKLKGHIDLSLRRVNQAQRINKNKEYKNEIKALRILESASKILKKNEKEVENIGYELIKQYGSLYKSFEQISENNELIKKFNMDAKLEETILHIINERIKPEEIFIKAEIKLQSMTSDGIDKIKEMLIKVKNDNITISYISAPKYNALIKAKDYKQGEAMLKEITETLTKEAKKSNCVFEIDKI